MTLKSFMDTIFQGFMYLTFCLYLQMYHILSSNVPIHGPKIETKVADQTNPYIESNQHPDKN